MRRKTTIKSAPPAGSLAVEWHDCTWVPVIVVKAPPVRRLRTKPLPASTPVAHNARDRRFPNSFKSMKMFSFSARRPRAGFTLVELLVVIAIIGILAAMLLAVIPSVTNAGKKTKARLEAQAIATAIVQYDSAYGRFPVSQQAQAAATANVSPANPNGSDFTYGGTFQNQSGALTTFGTMVSGSVLTNSEVIAILMNLTNYPNGSGSTINTNYQKNPQKTIFLNAKMSGWDPSQPGTPQPGVGNDLVYRDPWGNPYIITMDLNYDEQSQDAFYCLSAVSGPGGLNTNPGLNGLVNPDTTRSDNFRYHGKVMVWSAGQPTLGGKPVLDVNSQANSAYNKTHILSWQ
jgi:prepilin-type N-terminal cleavage/methylation domain-containing protein